MMKHLFICLIGWIASGYLFAQEAKPTVTPEEERLVERVDSLKQELAATPDSLQWEVLNALGRTFRKFKRKDSLALQEGIAYSIQAENLAIRLNDTSKWGKSLSNLIFFYGRKKGAEAENARKEKKKLKSFLLTYRGYTIPKSYEKWDGDKELKLDNLLLTYYDSTSSLKVEDIMVLYKDGKMNPPGRRDPFTPRKVDLGDYPESWWVRFRIKSESDHWEEHVFYTGEDRNNWDTVEVYVPQQAGGFEKSLTGRSLDPSEWEIPDNPNHFKISIPPKSDLTIFMRVKGFAVGFAPNRIRLKHINYESFLRERVKTRHANGVFQGVVLIQLFFFLLLYLTTRDHVYGNYAIYILGLSLFILTVNYFGKLDESIQFSLYILAIWLAVLGMLMFSFTYLNMSELMPKWRKPLTIFLIVFTAISAIIMGCLPFVKENVISTGNPGIFWGAVITISGFLYSLMIIASTIFLPIWGIRTLIKGYKPARYYLIATLFLFLGFLLPIGLLPFQGTLDELGFFRTFSISNVIEGGIALQLCLFALGVGHKRNLLEKERRDALEKNLAIQQEINAATDRFVPYEFLKTLGRESILDVNLGDQVEKNVTIFFSDIRDYTSLSEKLTPQQNFLFLNNYLGRVGPIIKTNRGFVNQYYGDGIMALFMDSNSGINSPKDSVLAAMEMHRELYQYNQERIAKNRDPINIGIGVHTGPLMLGVIGDEKRMDVSVVSDAVNTAARMEGLTKYYGASTIVSGSTFDGIANTDGLHYRFLGQVLVKGKATPIKIYDFYDGDREAIGLKKEDTQTLFQEGLAAYFDKDFVAAVKAFQEILQAFPEDKASRFYLEKSEAYLKTGVGEDWTGVEIIERK